MNDCKESPGRRGLMVVGICALLMILGLLVFGQTTRFDFVNYDDSFYVYQNPEVTQGLTPGGVISTFARKEFGLWNPLVTISHMLDCQFYGLNAGGHHLTNVLLHLASATLLFLILRQMTGALWRSAVVAALFAVHPLRVESVAWISERKDVLSGFFFMLTLGAYLRYVHRQGRGRYFLILLLFGMGLMCKPMLVTLPFVLLLLDYWPLNRLFLSTPAQSNPAKGFSINWRVVVEKIPLLVLTLGFCVATMLGPKETSSMDPAHVPFFTRMCEAPAGYVFYLGKMIWPSRLAVIYPHPEESLRWYPAALVLLGSLSLGIFLLRRKYPWLWMGWLWNLGMLVPVCGIVQISRHAWADHYNYLPQIGLYVALTWGMARWAGERRYRRVVLGGTTIVVLGILSVISYRQTSYWHDSVALFEHAISCTTDNNIAQDLLGKALADRQQHGQAIEHYKTALQIQPSDPKTWNNLGISLLATGCLDEAIHACQEALRLNPNFEDARNNLAVALNQAGRSDEAIKQFSEAVQLDPGNANTHYNLGNLYMNIGSIDEALAQFTEALRLQPAFAEAHCSIAIIQLFKGKIPDAIQHYTTALQLQPDNLQAMNALAWIYATSADGGFRNDTQAVSLAEQACRLTGPNEAGPLDILAAAYANAGRFPEAIKTATQALALADASGQIQLSQLIQSRLTLYNSGRPYRAPIIPPQMQPPLPK
ncbi:MAG: tetratricopeptide repeat protein [Chthoniobacteraceae bacterium]